MGVDYFGYVIVGVPCETVIRRQEEKATVTKYDPDTGKPYEKETCATFFVVGAGGKRYVNSDEAGWDLEKEKGLIVVDNFDDEPRRKKAIGLKLVEGDDGGCLLAITDDVVAQAKEKLLEILTSLGIENVRPTLFFSFGASC